MARFTGIALGVFVLAALGLAAPTRLRDDIHWRWAAFSDTTASYDSYLRLQGWGRHTREAQDRIEQLLTASTSADDLREFLRRFPASTLVESTRQKLAAVLTQGFDSGFRGGKRFTESQLKMFMERLQQETDATSSEQPLEYYEVVSADRCEVTKTKVVLTPSPGQKSVALRLRAGNLSVNAIYISTGSPSPPRALFQDKWRPTMTHNGCAGPGLEIKVDPPRQDALRNFLATFAIVHSVMNSISGGTLGVVVPDLLYQSDESGILHPHHGAEFHLSNGPLVFRVEGVTGLPKEPVTNYEQALALKTYLGIRQGTIE